MVRSTSSASSPAAAATSRARQARSLTTRSTGTPRPRIASRIVPLPEASTARRRPRRSHEGAPPRGLVSLQCVPSCTERGSTMKRQPTVADIVMFAGGVVTFIFSFLHFVADVNAWSSDVFGLFPITTLIGHRGPGHGGVRGARQLRRISASSTILSSRGSRSRLALGHLLRRPDAVLPRADQHGADSGAGLWLMLIGSLAIGGRVDPEHPRHRHPVPEHPGSVARPRRSGMPGPGAGPSAGSVPPPPPRATAHRRPRRPAGPPPRRPRPRRRRPDGPRRRNAAASGFAVRRRATKSPRDLTISAIELAGLGRVRARPSRRRRASASIFPCAVPLPPDTMAPAWPIFLPAGAVTPAM